MSFLGLISYPLYALHFPIRGAICIVSVRLHLGAGFAVVAAIVVCVAAA